MYIRIGYDISLRLAVDSAVLFCLKVHPDRREKILGTEHFYCSSPNPITFYNDSFGNECGRVKSSAGPIRFRSNAIIEDSGALDDLEPNAWQLPVSELPPETFQFLLPSRYCDADSELLGFAWQQFGSTPLGWARVQAICDFVHNHLKFDYQQARPTRTALEGFREKVGVCRDFTHLAITLCRCMNIPARYATGYLGDIGIAPVPYPMDFSAWMEVYLGGRWFTFDARHNRRRIGRVVMARGRDATDVAITTVFGSHILENFEVFTDEIPESVVPLEFLNNDETKVRQSIMMFPRTYRRSV